jgi:nucleoside-diphosphate-sugar epimerase
LKLIVGCGYLGRRVAERWLSAGQDVTGVVHSESSAKALGTTKVRPIIADVTQPETLHNLPSADTLLFCVGYGSDSSSSRGAVYVDGFRNVLNAVSPDVRRVIFISSTGVFAERNGGWVEEESRCEPMSESGRALFAAERVLAGHRLADRGVVLRLAGIYGPDRLPRRAELLTGEPLAVAAGQHVNLIHVEDAASAVLAAEERAQPPRTYVIADGHPVDRREYLAEMARQLSLPTPRFRDPMPGETIARRGGDKRVSNQRMLEELQVKLRFPTYREGLKAAVKNGDIVTAAAARR